MRLKTIIRVYLLLTCLFISAYTIAQVKPPPILVSKTKIKVSIDKGVEKYQYNNWKTDLEGECLDGNYAVFLERLINSDIPQLSYYDNIVAEGVFEEGYKIGLWRTLYKNKLVKTINYDNGLVKGEYIVYNSSGDVLYNTDFGLKGNGKYKDYYYYIDVLKEDGYYENGKKEGEWCEYDRKGKLIKSINYSRGIPQERE